MESLRDESTSNDIVDSLSTVEFDADRELFRAAYDSKRDSASLAVISVVGTALGKDLVDLPPLHSVIDTEALEKLFTSITTGVQERSSVSFCYEGFVVTVFSGGLVKAVPQERP